MEIKKLKRTEIKEVRDRLLLEQNGLCCICGEVCTPEQAVLDHDHASDRGYVRAVLHRTCNAVEGKIVNACKRYGIKDVHTFLTGLIQYHVFHAENRTGLIHPVHKTPEQKKERTKKRAKKKREAIKKEKINERKTSEKAQETNKSDC